MPRSGSVTSISELFRFCLFCVAKMKPLTAIVRARRLPERTKTEPGKYSWKFWFFDFSLLSEFRSLCSVQFLSFIFGQKTFAVTLDHRDRTIHDLYALDWSCSGAMIGSNFKTVLFSYKRYVLKYPKPLLRLFSVFSNKQNNFYDKLLQKFPSGEIWTNNF